MPLVTEPCSPRTRALHSSIGTVSASELDLGATYVSVLIDGTNALHESCESGDSEAFDTLMEHPDCAAASKRRDPNKAFPLHLFLHSRMQSRKLRRLVEMNPIALKSKDICCWYPLHYACKMGHGDQVELLTSMYPKAARELYPESALLPIHFASRSRSKTFGGMLALANAFPESVDVKDHSTNLYPISRKILLREKRHEVLRCCILSARNGGVGLGAFVHTLLFNTKDRGNAGSTGREGSTEEPGRIAKTLMSFVGLLDDIQDNEFNAELNISNRIDFELCEVCDLAMEESLPAPRPRTADESDMEYGRDDYDDSDDSDEDYYEDKDYNEDDGRGLDDSMDCDDMNTGEPDPEDHRDTKRARMSS